MNIEAIHSRDGYTYWIEQGDTLYGQRLRAGQYQKTNWQFVQTLLNNTRTAIDVGANNACNTIHYAGVFERVIAFEPTPLAQQLWQRTVRDNRIENAELHGVALAETAGTTEIIVHERNGGHNHLAHYDKNPRANPQKRTRKTHTVTQTPLDTYKFTDVDFIKIDVEGYELYVLQGAEQTLQRNRPILQLEIVANQCRKFNYEAETLIEYLRDRDYAVCSKRDGWLTGEFKGAGRSTLYNGVERKGDMDLFFIPREHKHLPPHLTLFE